MENGNFSSPRHLRVARVLHVDVADPRREDLHGLDRIALVVENDVRRVEVDVYALVGRKEFRQVRGALLPRFEDEVHAGLAAEVANELYAVRELGKRRLVGLVEEAGMQHEERSGPFLRERDGLAYQLAVLLPVLVRHDAASGLDGVERRVVLVGGVEHRGGKLPLAVGKQLLHLAALGVDGLGAAGAADLLGIAGAAGHDGLGVDERAQRELHVVDAVLLHLGRYASGRLLIAPGADG